MGAASAASEETGKVTHSRGGWDAHKEPRLEEGQAVAATAAAVFKAWWSVTQRRGDGGEAGEWVRSTDPTRSSQHGRKK